ncbi:MAG: A/G-specific adenine glycosylase [Betaproteobacteria bacterium]|nr:A/G-specific adenine glycosylase [Betaproteobacteria bacterium]
MSGFASRLVAWQKCHGRHDLPWQQTTDPYRIWVSEIMLQQTQVATVLAYYGRFLARFPHVAELARSSLDEVLSYWSGLGYYSRARNLHRAAAFICERHAALFPRARADILALPGVGRSTAAAISVFAFDARAAILDGNVKRVLARHAGISGPPGAQTDTELWAHAEALVPAVDVKCYTQGLMDLGALVCTRRTPSCQACPLAEDCQAYRQGRVAELPTPRPRKPLPEKTFTVLILRRGERIWLEPRPASGIWGGLWSFPEANEGEDGRHWCDARLGAGRRRVAWLPPIDHALTHFRMRIRPCLLELEEAVSPEPAAGGQWFALDDALRAGIPAPVRALLQGLRHAAP